MKRIIALVLTLLTLLSLSTVCAAETTSVKTTAKADEMDVSVIGSRCFVEKKSIYTDRGAAVTPSSTDSVVIDKDSGVFTVVTAAGTQMSITVPFGAYCITQDIYQQLEIYMSLFPDVSGALKNYVDNRIHMDIYDFYTGQSVYITESDDTFAAMMGDLSKLNTPARRQVADYMSKYWYGNYPAKLKTVGKNTYVAFDLSEDCGFVIYNTIVNGRLIEVYLSCDSGKAGMEELEKMIGSLTFGQSVAAEEVPEETVPAETETSAETEAAEETAAPPETASVTEPDEATAPEETEG